MFNLFKKKEPVDYSFVHTDMHSHLIPGIDDGAGDISESIELIKGLKELGFKKLITTPHIFWDMYPNTPAIINKGMDTLKKALSKNKIEIEIRAAAEYFLDENVKEMLGRKDKFLTIADNKVLVEFSMASPPYDLKEMIFELQMQGYQPVIAHPERYIYAARKDIFFDELKSAGCLFQLNMLSVAGFYGKSVQNLANHLIKKSFYSLAGTDLHSPRQIEALHNPVINDTLKKLAESGNFLNPLL